MELWSLEAVFLGVQSVFQIYNEQFSYLINLQHLFEFRFWGVQKGCLDEFSSLQVLPSNLFLESLHARILSLLGVEFLDETLEVEHVKGVRLIILQERLSCQ